MKLNKVFPSRLKEQRASEGLTQEQLAKKTGMGQDWISHLEAGRRMPSIEVFVKLANALNANADWLLGRDKSSINNKPKTKVNKNGNRKRKS